MNTKEKETKMSPQEMALHEKRIKRDILRKQLKEAEGVLLSVGLPATKAAFIAHGSFECYGEHTVESMCNALCNEFMNMQFSAVFRGGSQGRHVVAEPIFRSVAERFKDDSSINYYPDEDIERLEKSLRLAVSDLYWPTPDQVKTFCNGFKAGFGGDRRFSRFPFPPWMM